MELLFVILVLPLIGGGMLLFDWHRKSGMDLEARDFGRRMLRLLGWVALLHAAVVGGLLIRGVLTVGGLDGEGMLHAILRGIILAVLTFAGVNAVRVGGHDERDDLDLATQARRGRDVERLWAAELLLAGLPLVVPAAVVMFVGAGALGIFEVTASFGRAARTNRMLWTLALAASTGRPFAEEFEMTAYYERKRYWRRKLERLARELRDGTSLARALAAEPGLVPRHLITAIHVAEQSGRLSEVLPALATRNSQHLDQEEVHQRLSSLALSAWMSGVVLIVMSTFCWIYIIPKFKSIVNDFNMELPSVTERFVTVAGSTATHWYVAFPLISLPIILLIGLHQITFAAAQGRGGFLVRFFPRLEASNVLRALADATQCSAPADRTLEMMSQLDPHDQQRARLQRAQTRVGLGEVLGVALWDEGFLNASEAHALTSAERLGQLPWTMQLLAEGIDRRRLERFQWILELARPLLIIFIAALVLFFCLAMLAPIIHIIGGLM